MVKTMNGLDTAAPLKATKKQRKKQAKREAKWMLKLEQARKDLQKTEQKIAKTQSQLENRKTRLHDLEAKVDEIHVSQEQPAVVAITTEQKASEPQGEELTENPAPGELDAAWPSIEEPQAE